MVDDDTNAMAQLERQAADDAKAGREIRESMEAHAITFMLAALSDVDPCTPRASLNVPGIEESFVSLVQETLACCSTKDSRVVSEHDILSFVCKAARGQEGLHEARYLLQKLAREFAYQQTPRADAGDRFNLHYLETAGSVKITPPSTLN